MDDTPFEMRIAIEDDRRFNTACSETLKELFESYYRAQDLSLVFTLPTTVRETVSGTLTYRLINWSYNQGHSRQKLYLKEESRTSFDGFFPGAVIPRISPLNLDVSYGYSEEAFCHRYLDKLFEEGYTVAEGRAVIAVTTVCSIGEDYIDSGDLSYPLPSFTSNLYIKNNGTERSILFQCDPHLELHKKQKLEFLFQDLQKKYCGKSMEGEQ